VSKMAILSEAPKAEITQIIRPQSQTVGLIDLIINNAMIMAMKREALTVGCNRATFAAIGQCA
jgi:hypothetical protein